MVNLEGKVALVTGAGGMKGIGRACALKLAAQGADVVISDFKRDPADLPPSEVAAGWRSIDSVAQEVEALGRRCLKVWCDLTVSEQIEGMVRQATEKFGRLDIVVNNARALIGRDRVPITELAEDVWLHFYRINVTAVYLATKFAGQAMVKGGQGGRIINIASDAGKRPSGPNMVAYTSSKFAVIGLTQASALDLAPHKITVNSVCPGTTNTDRLNYAEQAAARAKGMTPEAYRAQIVQNSAARTPLGRIGESEDIANMVAFLASDDASFITGQSYNVNGGSLFT